MKSYRSQIILTAVLAAILGLLVFRERFPAYSVMRPTTNTNYGADMSDVRVSCMTTKGPLNIIVKPAWGRFGATRFLELVKDGFYTGLPIFRCMDGFICQFGVRLPQPNAKVYSPIKDDVQQPALRSFRPGYLSFAGLNSNDRTNHIFIALANVESLGSQPWETPFGYVASDSIQRLDQFTKYGEMGPTGPGPDPAKIEAPGGAEYLKKNFPKLDYFLSCSVK